MSDPAIEVKNLSLRFDGVQALNAVNLRVQPLELRCLVGPNGAGKSTLFKCLSGMQRTSASNGEIRIHGRQVPGLRPFEVVRLGVGIKTQTPSVMNGLTVSENLWLAVRRHHSSHSANAEVERAMELVGMQGVAHRKVGELSHGQRQVVEIGLVLAQRPTVVLLDEPAAGITGAEAERLLSLISVMNQQAAVVVVEHDMHFIRSLNATVSVLHRGAILREGNAEEVMNDDKVREVYLGRRAR